MLSDEQWSDLEPLIERLVLLALCAAYIQGPLSKIADFPAAIAEMEHFGLRPAALVAVSVIVFELAASAMVVSGFGRRPAALALAAFTFAATFLALRFWEMEPGLARQMAANVFFEHLGLAAAFVIVAGLGGSSSSTPARATFTVPAAASS